MNEAGVVSRIDVVGGAGEGKFIPKKIFRFSSNVVANTNFGGVYWSKIHPKERLMHFPYFRFSTEQPSVEDLLGWALHFESLGIPCAIVEEVNAGPHPCDDNKSTYTLWRAGEESIDPCNSFTRKPNNEKIKGVLVRTFLGFSKKPVSTPQTTPEGQ